MLKYKIPFKTPSVNQMYVTWSPKGSCRSMRIKSKEAKEVAKEIKKIVLESPYERLEGELKVTINIYSNWYTKSNTIRKKDLANFEKCIVDSIFINLEGMDDSQIFKLEMNKFNSKREYSVIKIESI